MSDRDLEALLRNDFNELAAGLEKDRFTERILQRLGAKRRARHGVLVFAGAAGAGLAASQFSSVVNAIAPQLASAASQGGAVEPAMQLIAMLLLAGVLLATAIIVRQEI